jgi:hypothetical protein
LKNIKTFEAENDLSIGNHTVTAQNLQSSQINRNSVLIGGYDGLLTQNENLVFSKGILTTPGIRVERLYSDLDVKGNQLMFVIKFFVFFLN